LAGESYPSTNSFRRGGKRHTLRREREKRHEIVFGVRRGENKLLGGILCRSLQGTTAARNRIQGEEKS